MKGECPYVDIPALSFAISLTCSSIVSEKMYAEASEANYPLA